MIDFKFLILIILFSFTLEKILFNSKPSEEELKEALKNIPKIYSELYKKMLDHPSEDEKDFTLEYFKKAESTIKTEYIQNIPSSKLIDIIPKIISLCQLDNSNHGMIKDLFENKILGMTDYFKFSPWMSFHFTDSKTVEKK
ncbi:MAG: hypothetical protein MJ252_09955 [archaeon]|nr:hypothetical protein [archaeon]